MLWGGGGSGVNRNPKAPLRAPRSEQTPVKHLDRKAKIICTIGPTSNTEEDITRLMMAGMDVARLNFSHGTHETHLELIRTVRRVSERLGKPVAILQDLQGPKIRIGSFEGGSVKVVSGERFAITTVEGVGDATWVSTPYRQLPHDVKPGSNILLHDGLIKMEVTEIRPNEVICTVVDGGVLYDRSGMSLPGTRISEPCFTHKDMRDLEFGLENGVDYVALSFVREPGDIATIRAHMGGSTVPVIAKLETTEALANLREIVAVADGVMVARGDLGVEISAARVPVVQKMAIEMCHHAGISVITATQMLDSMMSQPTPTRAEASDVANAVFDGSDAVMLSGETAFGEYPLKSVSTMAAIIREAEQTEYFRLGEPTMPPDRYVSAAAVCRAALHTAQGVDARAIVAFTKTGLSARLMSKFRPRTPIFACTPSEETMRRLALCWGTVPMQMDYHHMGVDQAIDEVVTHLATEGWIDKGDKLVIIAGSHLESGSGINMLRIYTYA
jgi:pyruvate kinase